jgi:hypothetical protein
MNTTGFYSYLLRALTTAELVEVSDLFPKQQINALFIKEIDELLKDLPAGPAMEDLQRFRQIDIVAYIDGSLRKAGFRDHERDELAQDVIAKLLLGNFFKGFRQGSLVARFKVSVSNAVATLVARRNRQRRRSHELPADVPSRSSVDDSIIESFRAWLRLRYSPLHQAVFDHRFDGGDTSDLLGSHDLTSYRLKKIVRDIKEAARDFARNDPAFLQMVMRAFSTEAETMKTRFGAVGAK